MRHLIATLAAALMIAASAAQSYPSKPVKLLVGFPAGGGLDVLARIVGQRVSEQWGQPIIVENKRSESTRLNSSHG